MHVVSSVARHVVLNDKHDNVSIAFPMYMRSPIDSEQFIF
jgi:hypothetical protein